MRFTLDIAKLPDGSYSAALANIDQFGKVAPIPPSDFEYAGTRLWMKWGRTDTLYEGTMENGKLIGTWWQGGGGFPLTFERDPAR